MVISISEGGRLLARDFRGLRDARGFAVACGSPSADAAAGFPGAASVCVSAAAFLERDGRFLPSPSPAPFLVSSAIRFLRSSGDA
jgi:hypothetical protein